MLEQLHEIFSSGRVRTDDEALAIWGTDWTRVYTPAPRAVVFPETIEEVVATVELANDLSLALVPSGGRTGLSAGAVACEGEVVVSFDRMNRILDFDPTDRLVRCQAGVITEVLQAFAEEKGLFYPVDFASSGSSQIGGNIATNAGGIKVIRYGLTRDWVAGLTVVTGTGEVLRLNRGLVKNATGYDLRHLFIGSEGTLGFVVEAEVRLTAAPAPQRVMVLAVPDFAAILRVLEGAQRVMTLSAFEFFSELAMSKVISHRGLRRPVADKGSYYALMEFDASATDAALALFESCVAEGLATDGVLSNSDAEAADLWALREGISESITPDTPYKNDLSVRVSRMPEFLTEVDRLVAANYPDFEVCWYGHIGDGNLHLNILKPASLSVDNFYARCHEISPQIFEVVQRLDGSVSAEHGVGLLKREFLGYTRSAGELAVMWQLKRVFDPNGIMNPGKLLDPAEAPGTV